MNDPPPLRIGLFGIGLEAYWPQFEGLRDRLAGYVGVTRRHLERDGVEVVDLGLIDSVDKAFDAGHASRRADVDVIFLHVTTYALSSTVLPVVKRANVPVIVLNLQPVSAIDYGGFNRLGDRTEMTGEWLAHCGACPLPEIANVFTRSGITFHPVTGTLEDHSPGWREVDHWIEAARVAHVMAHNRLGVMGHYYHGMLDIYADMTRQCADFGGHVQVIEIDELAQRRREVTGDEAEARVRLFREAFDMQDDCQEDDLRAAAKTSVALDRLVEHHRLGSMAYFYHSVPGHEHEDVIATIILGNSLLTARGVQVAGEYEIKNAQAMKIMDSFGAGGSFTEFYALDFDDDVVLMGHDGPGHTAIAQGKTKVRPLAVYHGKVGRGLSVEMSVRHGPVTLLSVVECNGGKGLKLLVAEGESVPGPILEIGNTNSRYRLPLPAPGFVEAWNAHGPAHHCAVGVGRLAGRLDKLGKLLGIDVARVC